MKVYKLLFKGMLGWDSGLPPYLPGLGTGMELCWLAPPMAEFGEHGGKWWLQWLTYQSCYIRITYF